MQSHSRGNKKVLRTGAIGIAIVNEGGFGGTRFAEMFAGIDYVDIVAEIVDLTAKGELAKTSLKAKMADTDPDDGVDPIAYDKGYHCLHLFSGSGTS